MTTKNTVISVANATNDNWWLNIDELLLKYIQIQVWVSMNFALGPKFSQPQTFAPCQGGCLQKLQAIFVDWGVSLPIENFLLINTLIINDKLTKNQLLL